MNHPIAINQSAAMSLETALRQRRSVRGFLAKPVPEATLTEIFELARWTPSHCNVQPWQVFVASGATRDELKRRMVKRVMTDTPAHPDFERAPGFEGVYRERQVDSAVRLYRNMGIDRHDKVGRERAMLRNFELFDAPHVCFIGMDRHFGVTAALDVGMYIQTLMLLLTAHGIGSCAQGALRCYPDDVREVFGINDNTAILLGISFGYEDETIKANCTRTDRAALTENVVFRT